MALATLGARVIAWLEYIVQATVNILFAVVVVAALVAITRQLNRKD